MKKYTFSTRRRNLILAFFLLFLATFLLVLLSVLVPKACSFAAEKRFSKITEKIFREELSGDTLSLHYSLAEPTDFGLEPYAPILSFGGDSPLSEQADRLQSMLASITSVDAPLLSPDSKRLQLQANRLLGLSNQLLPYRLYEEPLSPSSGAQSSLPILLAEYTFRGKQDIEDYLSLLDQIDDYFADLLAFEKEKAAAGLLQSPALLASVCEQCDTICSRAAIKSGHHFLQDSFKERLQPLSEQHIITRAEYDDYLHRNNCLLVDVLLPAYRQLKEGLLALSGADRSPAGLASLPSGSAYYELLLRKQTGSYLTLPEIKELFLTSLLEERRQLAVLLSEADSSVVSTDLNTDFPLSSPAEMLLDLQRRMAGSFPLIPGEAPVVTVKEVSASLAPYCAPAFYLTAPLDDTAESVIYINPEKTASGLELYTTLAHEGYPGHLYQDVYCNRRILTKGEDPLSSILWYGGFQEGWALYVETLSYDYASDLYREQGQPDEALLAQIEKHSRNLQLCLCSLLDIMIHSENAQVSDVSAFLQSLGYQPSAAGNLFSYIVGEPCNYPKYYLGYLEILRLRETAKAVWESSYSDLKFHTFLMENGPSDFATLAELLTE